MIKSAILTILITLMIFIGYKIGRSLEKDSKTDLQIRCKEITLEEITSDDYTEKIKVFFGALEYSVNLDRSYKSFIYQHCLKNGGKINYKEIFNNSRFKTRKEKYDEYAF